MYENFERKVIGLDKAADEVNVNEYSVGFKVADKEYSVPFGYVASIFKEYTVPGVAGILGRIKEFYKGKDQNQD
jgi:hypothetical protein